MRLALISGGSRGLGAALYQAFERQGFTVIEFSRGAPHAGSHRVDFCDPQSAASVMREVLRPLVSQPWQEVVAVINAATVLPMGPLSRASAADIVDNVHLNVAGSLVFAAEAMRAFQAAIARKTLVNISSGAALRALAGWSLYCAGKAAVEHFIRALALEQESQPQPFRALNVDPGVMDTQMQVSIRAADKADFPDVARFVHRQAEGELRDPAIVADAIVRIVASGAIENGSRVAAADFIRVR